MLAFVQKGLNNDICVMTSLLRIYYLHTFDKILNTVIHDSRPQAYNQLNVQYYGLIMSHAWDCPYHFQCFSYFIRITQKYCTEFIHRSVGPPQARIYFSTINEVQNSEFRVQSSSV